MNQTVATLIFAVLLSFSILWAGGVGLVSYRNWHDTHSRIGVKRDAGKQHCHEDFLDIDARERCESMHDVQYVTEINVAIATRAVVAALPLAALILAVALAWRRMFGQPKSPPTRAGRRAPARKRPT